MHATGADDVAVPRLRMAGVQKRFGATVALAGVDLAVRPGEIHALIGENGAGKSTLMKVLSGAILPDEGRMWLDDQAYTPRTPLDGRRAGVAMIYQELALAPHLSVSDNVVLGEEPTWGPFVHGRDKLRCAAAAFAELGRPDFPLDVAVQRLSLADGQLVEVARALVTGCRVLVLDEPTSSLPRDDVDRLFALIRRLAASGVAVVYISHALEEVRELCERYTVLRDGRTVGSGIVASTRNDEIVTLMAGRKVSELFPRSSRSAGEVLLDVEQLSGKRLPIAANIVLRRGEVLGIAGLIGAGRTELTRALFGLDPIKSGRLRTLHISGQCAPARLWQTGAGMLSEDRKNEGLALGLSIADNICLPRYDRLGGVGAALRFVLPGRQDAAAKRYIERVGVKCLSARQLVRALSGGNQQKVAFARLLYCDCDLLLLDEPTRGIDIGARANIYQLIDDLARGDVTTGRTPCAALVVSSSIPELLGICDRVAVMTRGRLGPFRPVAELTEHQVLLEATGAGAA